MEERSNLKYKQLLESINFNEIVLSEKLRKLLNEGFIENDACIHYKNLSPNGKFSSEFVDRTGNEVFYNKIQIDDYFDLDDFNKQIEQSILFINLLARKLKDYSKNEMFKVIFSTDYEYCNITFFKYRVNEEYLVNDLNLYENEAIIELSV